MKCKNEINKQIYIYDKNGELIEKFVPDALENCMKPGEFRIIPVSIAKDGDTIKYSIGDKSITVSKADIEAGIITIKEMDYEPQIVRRHGSCNPCRNCGACSW